MLLPRVILPMSDWGIVAGLVSSGNAAVLFDEPGVGRHDNDVQLQLTAS